MNRLASATLITLQALALGCIDAQIRPVLPPADGGGTTDFAPQGDGVDPRTDSFVPTALPTLYAVAGNPERVCVAGEDLVACKRPGADAPWQRLSTDEGAGLSLRGVAVGQQLQVVAVGQRNGAGVVLQGFDGLKPPLDSVAIGPLHDVASVGGLFVAVGEGHDLPGTSGAAAWQVAGERIEPWPALDASNQPGNGPLRAIWSDGARVAVAGNELWLGDVRQIASTGLQMELAVDLVGLPDGSVLVLGERNLIWWQAQDRWTELASLAESGRALQLAEAAPDGQAAVYLLGASSLYQLDLDAARAGNTTPLPVTIEGLGDGGPRDLHDLWVQGDTAVLVGAQLLASCRIIQTSTEASTIFSCQAEFVEEPLPPPPPPPPPSCTDVQTNSDQCVTFDALEQELAQRCGSDAQRQLVGVLPQELCLQRQELSFLGAVGTCCDLNTAECQDLDTTVLSNPECMELASWLQRADEACRQLGMSLRGLLPGVGCGNGTFNLRGANCCK